MGKVRCVDGRVMRHDPQWDDPYLETDIGQCGNCDGKGCDPVECEHSPTGKHQVDTSMESGPNNCFYCEQPMRAAGSSPQPQDPTHGRLRELRVALNTSAGLGNPATVHRFQVLLDDLEASTGAVPEGWQREALLDLLAVIHRDGGHYTATQGLAKSVADAMQISSERIAALFPPPVLTAALEEARECLRVFDDALTDWEKAAPDIHSDSALVTVRLGDLRRARSAYAALSGEGE